MPGFARTANLGRAQASLRSACHGLRDLEDGLNGNGVVVLVLEAESLIPRTQHARKLLARTHCFWEPFPGEIGLA